VKSSFLINPVCDILCRQFNRAECPARHFVGERL